MCTVPYFKNVKQSMSTQKNAAINQLNLIINYVVVYEIVYHIQNHSYLIS